MPRLPLLATLLAALALSAAGCKDDEGCSSGQTECNGVCRDAAFFQTDADNCGACGVVCGFGTCVAGACECDPAATACPPGNPRCIDTSSDPQNCGACGVVCQDEKPGSGCAAGVCACVAPRDDECGGSCTDTLTDPRNCGVDAAAGCGNDCPLANDVCAGGTCACPASRPTVCGTACVDTLSDPRNCGPQLPESCGNECPLANDVCVGGTCTCPDSLPDPCATRCVRFADDEENCGGCGIVCPAGSTCTAGTCELVCAAPTPQRCGTTCCAGSACCGGGTSCQTSHANGLGGTYFDCGALDEHTRAQALLAAESWSPTGTTFETGIRCPVSCLCRQSTTQAAVWCYAGSAATGRVLVTSAANCLAAECPESGVSGVSWR